jgi:hypothetical protein
LSDCPACLHRLASQLAQDIRTGTVGQSRHVFDNVVPLLRYSVDKRRSFSGR